MKKSVLIFGAGSIGNHMANACSNLNYHVNVTDISNEALLRMKNFIFPKRYKKWNNKIKLINYEEVFKNKKYYNLIIIGTPPSTHLKILKTCLSKLAFSKVLIEKPLVSFRENLDFFNKFKSHRYIFCGYNHSISPSINFFFKMINLKGSRKIKFIDLQWREGWSGILGAHSWLKNEFDSYLGNYKIGGGSIQEHSHGLHLAICLMEDFFKKPVNMKSKNVFFKRKKNKKYDQYSQIYFSNGKQNLNLEIDLLRNEPKKEVNVFLNKETISWVHNYSQGADAVIIFKNNKKKIKLFKKDRSAEFVNEIQHIENVNSSSSYNNSRLRIYFAIKTIKIIKKFFDEKYR